MVVFERSIAGIVIQLRIAKKLYCAEKELMNSILRTFVPIEHSICCVSDIWPYYILDEDMPAGTNEDNCTICNTKNPKWFFILTSNLEAFFSRILKCTVLHSSCLSLNGMNMLLIGERFSGKTTFTKYLSIDKEGYLVDDDCVYLVDNKCVGFCLPLPMRNSTNTNDCSYVIGKTEDEDDITRVLYRAPKGLSEVNHVDIILFIKYDKDSKNTIHELSKSEVYNILIKNIRAHYSIRGMYVDLFSLTSCAKGYYIEYSSKEEVYKDLLCDCSDQQKVEQLYIV